MSETEKLAPVHGYAAGIPWSLHLEAWSAYAKLYGTVQSPHTIAKRGGFHAKELDDFLPGWRDKISEIQALQRRVGELEADKIAWRDTADTLEHERETLQRRVGELEAERDAMKAVHNENALLRSDFKALTAESERLRAALDKVKERLICLSDLLQQHLDTNGPVDRENLEEQVEVDEAFELLDALSPQPEGQDDE